MLLKRLMKKQKTMENTNICVFVIVERKYQLGVLSNCRWITIQQQQYNKTTSKYITYNGETKTLVEWAKILNENEEVDNLYVNNKTLFVGANMMLLNGK